MILVSPLGRFSSFCSIVSKGTTSVETLSSGLFSTRTLSPVSGVVLCSTSGLGVGVGCGLGVGVGCGLGVGVGCGLGVGVGCGLGVGDGCGPGVGVCSVFEVVFTFSSVILVFELV